MSVSFFPVSAGVKVKLGVPFSTGPAERGGVAVMALGNTNSGLFIGDFGCAVSGVSGIAGP